MTKENNSYVDHINSLFEKINKGEKVYPDPPKEDPVIKEIKEKGVQKVITSIFTEGYEIPTYLNEEEYDTQIEGSKYTFVQPPSSHQDADNYWNDISKNFMHLGTTVKNKAGTIETKVMDMNNTEQVLKISLVIDESPEKSDKPSIAFSYINSKINPTEVTNFISKVGLKVDRTELKQAANWIVAEVSR